MLAQKKLCQLLIPCALKRTEVWYNSLVKYHIQGRKKEQPSTNDKAALNVILHDCTKTRGFSRYMGIVFLQLFPNGPQMSHLGLLQRSLIPVKQGFPHGKQASRQGSVKKYKVLNVRS